VVNNLGKNTPLHFSAYHPDFKMPSRERTPNETLDMAYQIAKDEGLYYPYIGNVLHAEGSNTYCPSCHHLIIGRLGFKISKITMTQEKKCPNCGYDLNQDIIGIKNI
jgi:pyruvate formate lyase activating enzyme